MSDAMGIIQATSSQLSSIYLDDDDLDRMKGRLDLWSLLVVLAFVVSAWNLYVGTRHGHDKTSERNGDLSIHLSTRTTNNTRTHTSSLDMLASESIIKRKPSDHACDGVDGIYHIAMTDILGGVGTGLLQLVINQIDFARRHNLKPWVHLNNSSQVVYDPVVHSQGLGVKLQSMRAAKSTYVRRPEGHWRDAVPGPPNITGADLQRDFLFAGTGIWEHYFEPVSDFVPGDVSCKHKLLVSMDLYLITPGLHGYSHYATRCWRYDYLPEYITKPHIPLDSWLRDQRLRAHDVMEKYIRFKPYLRAAALQANPGCNQQAPCLGLHIRHSDKAAGRRLLETSQFLPFAQAFVDNGGSYIYLATDSSNVLDEIRESWPTDIQSRIRRMGDDAVRSSDQQAVFDIGSHHRTNKEALIEILALSQCQYLVHGLSAVSESSIWINIGLHNRSVNLEDPDHLNSTSFGTLVKMSLGGRSESYWPHATRTETWWKPTQLAHEKSPSSTSCTGYNGVLLISSISHKSSAASAFFIDVLNQLVYAKRYNLIPWIHLQNGTDFIFDQEAHQHSSSTRTVVSSIDSMARPISIDNHPSHKCPSDFETNADYARSSVTLQGNGIWDSYFSPVSVFPSSDPTCSKLSVVSLNERHLSPVLKELCPYSVKAWRYDNVPEWRPANTPLGEWYAKMRLSANDIIKQHYAFRPHIVQRAMLVNPTEGGSICLGVHIRVGDKMGTHVEKVKADQYLPYLQAFERAGGRAIFVASDSHRAIQYITKAVPNYVSRLIRTQGSNVVRTYKEYPTHFLDGHHRVNSETLVDILALSKCSLLLHSHSTMAEAATYLNIDLHNNSVCLEDADRLTAEQFESYARNLIRQSNHKVA
jgi:hypothetical protein